MKNLDVLWDLIKERGAKLLKQRPPGSMVDDLKKFYYERNTNIVASASADEIEFYKGKDRIEMNFFSCRDDEERFWYSMYVLQCATKGYNNSIPGVEALEDHIIEHAKDFGMEHEVAKIMLSIGGKIDDRGTWRPK